MIRCTSAQAVIYDHDLLPQRRFKERMARAWEVAKEEGKGKRVVTAAEQLGTEPPILRC